jgi:hypothetical protein
VGCGLLPGVVQLETLSDLRQHDGEHHVVRSQVLTAVGGPLYHPKLAAMVRRIFAPPKTHKKDSR